MAVIRQKLEPVSDADVAAARFLHRQQHNQTSMGLLSAESLPIIAC